MLLLLLMTVLMCHYIYLALSSGHSQIYLAAMEKLDFSPQLRDKIGEWPGDEADIDHKSTYEQVHLITDKSISCT